jgi:UDP-glucose 4-epimerase
MVIPRFVKAALNNTPISIHGDGSQKRVFCHVLDAVSATLMLARSNKTVGEVFNIGGKDEISILDLANLIIYQTNSKSKITFTSYEDAYKVGYEDMSRRVPNLSKIEKFTGWRPKLSLKEIITDVISSFA